MTTLSFNKISKIDLSVVVQNGSLPGSCDEGDWKCSAMNTEARALNGECQRGGEARPFLKWAGGKRQILSAILKIMPKDLLNGSVVTYVEPFVGSGAVMFRLLRELPKLKRVIINDLNRDLVTAYAVVKVKPGELIERLRCIEDRFCSLSSPEQQSKMFYEIRACFNRRQASEVEQTSHLIFLNKTCFNGLYRVNRKNEFNVPFGRYKNPTICDEENNHAVRTALQKVEILNGDFEDTIKYIEGPAFYYFDPPYRPISKTASFNAYANDVFGDEEQNRLKLFCDRLSDRGVKWLLSNSDPKNCDPADDFFDKLYLGYALRRIKAKRAINSKAKKRGDIFELLISNYSD